MESILWAGLAFVALVISVVYAVKAHRLSVSGLWAISFTNPGYPLFASLTPARLLSPFAFVRWRNGRGMPFPARILVVMAGWVFISAFWSPQPSAAILTGIDFLAAAAVLYQTHLVRGDLREILDTAYRVLAPWILLCAFSVIVFRLFPSQEISYLSSPTAELFQGDYALRAVGGEVEVNVTSDDKSGGLFFNNGNRAALVLGVATLSLLVIALITKKKSAVLVALICAVAVVATGSKTGLVLLLVLPIACLIISGRSAVRGRTRAFSSILILIAVFALCWYFTLRFMGAFYEKVDTALVPRELLWGHALEFLAHNWMIGGGFGSWAESWEPIALANNINPDYPPHNFLLWYGANSGIVPIVLSLVFTIFALLPSVRVLRNNPVFRLRLVAMLTASGWIWVFVHGMGDNTEVFGVLNNVVFLALMQRVVVDTACVEVDDLLAESCGNED